MPNPCLPPPSHDTILHAVSLLKQGEVIAFPTETVYGLGADAANAKAVARIFSTKSRPADHPLIVHLADTKYLTTWASGITDIAWKLAQAFWPGPLTLILKKQHWVPRITTGGQDTIGLRVPGHPVALQLLNALLEENITGLAAPSANRFGRISPTTAGHVREELGGKIPLILDGGPCQIGIESTIIDLSRGSPKILRPGFLGIEQLSKVLGKHWEQAPPPAEKPETPDNAPRVPGMLASHYAPQTPTCLVKTSQLPQILAEKEQAGSRCGILAYTAKATQNQPPFHLWRTIPPEPAAYAHDLYNALRELDRQKLKLIIVETPPNTQKWAAIADRLSRATKTP